MDLDGSGGDEEPSDDEEGFRTNGKDYGGGSGECQEAYPARFEAVGVVGDQEGDHGGGVEGGLKVSERPVKEWGGRCEVDLCQRAGCANDVRQAPDQPDGDGRCARRHGDAEGGQVDAGRRVQDPEDDGVEEG